MYNIVGGVTGTRTGPIKWTQMFGGLTDRVHYAEVLLFFKAEFQTTTAEKREECFAWVQWFHSFGSGLGESDSFTDPAFPSILTRRFPRVYMMEEDLGAKYDVIPVQHILAPAPLHDDVTLVFKPALDIANENGLAGRAREEFLKANKYNETTIRPDWNCSRFATCNDPTCRRLHSWQMVHGDQARTRLYVVNLLVMQMSSGSLYQPPEWAQQRCAGEAAAAAEQAAAAEPLQARPGPAREVHWPAGDEIQQDQRSHELADSDSGECADVGHCLLSPQACQ